MSLVVSVDRTPYTRRKSPLSCSNATSNRWSGLPGVEDQTCPRLVDTVQDGVHTYPSSNPSSLTVTKIRVVGTTGDQAIRIARTGLPDVPCSTSAPHEDPSHVLVFGHRRREVAHAPVLERYAIPASVELAVSRYWMNKSFADWMWVGNTAASLLGLEVFRGASCGSRAARGTGFGT